MQSVQANGGAARSQSGSSTWIREQIKSVVDPNICERLRDFSGCDEDFLGWSTKLSGLAALSGLDEVMHISTSEPDDDIVMSAQDVDSDVQGKPQAIYFMLLQACQGKAFSIARAVQNHSGFRAWRKLCREYEPEVASRHSAMMMSLLTPAWNDKTPLGTQLTAWGYIVGEYVRSSGESFHDSMKVAVLTRLAPEASRSSIVAMAARTDGDYRRMKTELLPMGQRPQLQRERYLDWQQTIAYGDREDRCEEHGVLDVWQEMSLLISVLVEASQRRW